MRSTLNLKIIMMTMNLQDSTLRCTTVVSSVTTLVDHTWVVFNKQLVGARDKPIITYLEYIREYLTKRIVNVKSIIAKTDNLLTHVATAMLDTIKNEASQYNVLMTGSSMYQVTGPRNKTWLMQEVGSDRNAL
ncbi:hypothetical protein HanHA300_Chr09g0328001 [Helianthus annuus]|nr:hypothetical protein HanHA300_Chr09g0328001 [Helianthus annuus]KAJ0543269.1 hypothetical protein HanHA89_Chr09g0348911 [Helianthus annuus]KAJ0708325.1 hypothetical protein HanLR1_Chr09g0328241 [Helianthus annuus]